MLHIHEFTDTRDIIYSPTNDRKESRAHVRPAIRNISCEITKTVWNGQTPVCPSRTLLLIVGSWLRKTGFKGLCVGNKCIVVIALSWDLLTVRKVYHPAPPYFILYPLNCFLILTLNMSMSMRYTNIDSKGQEMQSASPTVNLCLQEPNCVQVESSLKAFKAFYRPVPATLPSVFLTWSEWENRALQPLPSPWPPMSTDNSDCECVSRTDRSNPASFLS